MPWQPRKNESLPSDVIRKLFVSRDGALWIGTHNGLARWKDGKLALYTEFLAQRVDALAEDREGTVWVGLENVPAWRLCAVRKGAAQCYGQDGSFGGGISSLFEENGSLWIGAFSGLWRWKPDAPKRYANPEPRREFSDFSTADDGRLLIGMPGGLKQLEGERIEASPIGALARPPHVYRLLRDRNGGLWIGTLDSGLLHVHQGRTDRFTRSDGLSGDTVAALFEDREGNIWAGTTERLDRFRDFTIPSMSSKQGLAGDVVGAVLAARDGSVWIGGFGGVSRWKDGQITIYRKRDGLPDDIVQGLLEDSRGRIWVSTGGGRWALRRRAGRRRGAAEEVGAECTGEVTQPG